MKLAADAGVTAVVVYAVCSLEAVNTWTLQRFHNLLRLLHWKKTFFCHCPHMFLCLRCHSRVTHRKLAGLNLYMMITDALDANVPVTEASRVFLCVCVCVAARLVSCY